MYTMDKCVWLWLDNCQEKILNGMNEVVLLYAAKGFVLVYWSFSVWPVGGRAVCSLTRKTTAYCFQHIFDLYETLESNVNGIKITTCLWVEMASKPLNQTAHDIWGHACANPFSVLPWRNQLTWLSVAADFRRAVLITQFWQAYLAYPYTNIMTQTFFF